MMTTRRFDGFMNRVFAHGSALMFLGLGGVDEVMVDAEMRKEETSVATRLGFCFFRWPLAVAVTWSEFLIQAPYERGRGWIWCWQLRYTD
jgi:hypothetical protein